MKIHLTTNKLLLKIKKNSYKNLFKKNLYKNVLKKIHIKIY